MKFYERLRQADKEKLVEEAYHIELQDALKRSGGRVVDLKIENNTDGIIKVLHRIDDTPYVYRIIIETKYAESFDKAIVRAKVLMQVVCYLKKQEELGDTPPRIIFVGDRDECFTLHTKYVQKYVQRDIHGIKSPSTAWQHNPDVLKEMSEDIDLQEQCFVYLIDEQFDMKTVVEKMLHLVRDIKLITPITEKGISKIFDYFTMRILKYDMSGNSEYTPRELVEYFMKMLLENDDCYLHAKKKDIALFGHMQVPVNSDAYRAFTALYEFKYTLDEQKAFTSICDRLIEDSDRRRKGDFYTPTIWVDEAHKMLAENLGESWKENYVVWDCACGTKNLTRDYKFANLYSSTLEQHDLSISTRYNKDSVAFQYDFLNDDVELFEELRKKKEQGDVLVEADFRGSKLYREAYGLLKDLLLGEKVLFFINPPYGTANNQDARAVGGSKQGVAKTKVNERMLQDSIGASSQQLYAQFIYRISQIFTLFDVKGTLGLFSPTLYLTGSTFTGLRTYLSKYSRYLDGFLLQASNFADVAGNWGISFSMLSWDSCAYLNNTCLSVKGIGNSEVFELQSKKLYNLDGLATCSDWLKEGITGLKTEDAPQLSSALKVKQTGRGKLVKSSLGYFVNVGNSVYKNSTDVFIVSGTSSTANGSSILPLNFLRVVSNYAARRLIMGQHTDWVNDKDEYRIPNTENEFYQQWENDCIVYSLFNTASNQSSLRNIDYNNKRWDIYNHFFFMSKQEMLELAHGKHDRSTMYNEVEQDIIDHAADERFVYTKLQGLQLSPDAQAVLDKARELVNTSFKYRELFNQEHPEYHINTWDAGWYQIKGMLKVYDQEGLKEFTALYKAFEDRMRPLVYELGFLYK